MNTPMSAGFIPDCSEDKADAFDDAQFRGLRGGQNLAAPALASGFKDNIGEGAADIGGEFDGFAHGRDTYYCAARKS